MKIEETDLIGCMLLETQVHLDNRGIFQKLYNKTLFDKFGLVSNFIESYYSISNKNVIRGMHFQKPPYDHEKMVACLSGKVIDVVIDLRRKSSTYGMVYSTELSEYNRRILYIPKGCAHGFLAISDLAMMVYYVTSEYNAECDAGIRWDSINFEWNIENPIISERDKQFDILKNFISPF